ncbi:MAG TPA: WG repeat-containing protein [Bacteroidetes bacterium]|nr:WG repeat-containing protein [Bacteroidota bacterium]
MLKSKSFFILGCLLFTLALGACTGKENKQSAPSIDPLTGIDTSRVVITEEELLETEGLVLVPFRKGEYWGFADTNMHAVILPGYTSVEPFWENVAVVEKNGAYGVIDKRGREIIPIRFTKISRSACGVFTVQTPDGFILVKNDGKRVNNIVYPGMFSYTCSEGRIPVMENEKIGFLDKNGRKVIPSTYDAVYKFQHGVAPVRKGSRTKGKWGVIDRAGNVVAPFEFGAIFPFVNGLGVAMRPDSNGNAQWGVIDTLGREIIPFRFGGISGTFSGEYVACQQHDAIALYKEGLEEDYNTWFIYDRQGKQTGRSVYELWDDFSEGLIVVQMGNKYGFANAQGQVVIPAEYDWACGFQQGLAWVKKDSLCGFINRAGKVVIPIKYASAQDYVFMEDWGARVMDPFKGEHVFLDRNGREFRK